MTSPRPAQVGNYDLLEDFETDDATVRVLRIAPAGQSIQQHLHERTTQIYVALQGHVRVEVDGKTLDLEPFRATVIPAGKAHAAAAVDEMAILMNISVPPLAADDQILTSRLERAEAG